MLGPLRGLLLAEAAAMKDATGPPAGINPLVDGELARRRVAIASTRAATLAKLFLLAMPVPIEEAEQALAPVGTGVLAGTGLAEVVGDEVRLWARVTPYEGIVIASDIPRGSGPPDFVTGPSPAARRVDRLTIRRPVSKALDLGTGSGIQALRSAGHCEQVVAVDVNERALDFARFNAALNGIRNVDFRRGSWFEPVGEERFDLIVANPPYVVSPDNELLYRDGDLGADAVTEKLLREAPAHLEEGGFAHVMGNWIHGRDEDWRDPVERWLTDSGCDALLLRYPDVDLVSYAAQWNLLLAAESPDTLLAAVDRWLAYYRDTGIEAIAHGMVVLRRRPGGRIWVRAIEVPGSPTGSAGDHVLRMFEARDRREDAASATRFRPAPGLKRARRAMELEDGVGFSVPVPPGFAARLAGSADLDSDELATARRLFALGLLELP